MDDNRVPADLAHVIWIASRLAETPADQHLLALDRLNDLRIALYEYDKGIGIGAAITTLRDAILQADHDYALAVPEISDPDTWTEEHMAAAESIVAGVLRLIDARAV